MLGNLRKKTLTNIAILLARDNLPELISNLTLNPVNKFERKLGGKGAVRAGKGFTLFISNEDLNDIIKILKSLEDSGVLIDGVTETVNLEQKTRKQTSWSFLSTFTASLVQPVISSAVKGISGRGVRRAGRRYMDNNF